MGQPVHAQNKPSNVRCKWETSNTDLGIQLHDPKQLTGHGLGEFLALRSDEVRQDAAGYIFASITTFEHIVGLKLQLKVLCVILAGDKRKMAKDLGIEEQQMSTTTLNLKDPTSGRLELRPVTLVNVGSEKVKKAVSTTELSLPSQETIELIFEVHASHTPGDVWKMISDRPKECFQEMVCKNVSETHRKEGHFFSPRANWDASIITMKMRCPKSAKEYWYARSGSGGVFCHQLRTRSSEAEEDFLHHWRKGATLTEVQDEVAKLPGDASIIISSLGLGIRFKAKDRVAVRKVLLSSDERWCEGN